MNHRPYSIGFHYGEPRQHTAHAHYLRDWRVVEVITSRAPDDSALCELCSKFARRDELELTSPGVRPVSPRMGDLTDGDGLPVPETRRLQVPFRLGPLAQVSPLSFLWRKAVGL